jgi:hypothetical protein
MNAVFHDVIGQIGLALGIGEEIALNGASSTVNLGESVAISKRMPPGSL